MGSRRSDRQTGFRYEREDQLRDAQVRDFTGVIALNGVEAGGLRAALNQPFGGQAKHISDQHPDQRRNQRGEQQGSNTEEADFTQLRGIMQTGDRAQNGGETSGMTIICSS